MSGITTFQGWSTSPEYEGAPAAAPLPAGGGGAVCTACGSVSGAMPLARLRSPAHADLVHSVALGKDFPGRTHPRVWWFSNVRRSLPVVASQRQTERLPEPHEARAVHAHAQHAVLVAMILTSAFCAKSHTATWRSLRALAMNPPCTRKGHGNNAPIQLGLHHRPFDFGGVNGVDIFFLVRVAHALVVPGLSATARGIRICVHAHPSTTQIFFQTSWSFASARGTQVHALGV
ncbi:hypothetical protein GGX14DRAFT_587800 [Mycena pura]|uniref:Uncharacterized protein n=1 Tax=Mycena pura TaxID=153505 RepID=A0AAD6UZQ6_9AGAR|nr:hypothetical protein GGX14DRAFT_587800 [Mycena pura]